MRINGKLQSQKIHESNRLSYDFFLFRIKSGMERNSLSNAPASNGRQGLVARCSRGSRNSSTASPPSAYLLPVQWESVGRCLNSNRHIVQLHVFDNYNIFFIIIFFRMFLDAGASSDRYILSHPCFSFVRPVTPAHVAWFRIVRSHMDVFLFK